mgnify:CR=1 FL=1
MHFLYFVIISPWKREGPFIWTNLNSLHPRMLCAKFGWNCLSGSGEEDFLILSMYFRYFLIISPWKRTGPFISLWLRWAKKVKVNRYNQLCDPFSRIFVPSFYTNCSLGLQFAPLDLHNAIREDELHAELRSDGTISSIRYDDLLLFFSNPHVPLVLWYSYISDPFSRRKSSHAPFLRMKSTMGVYATKLSYFLIREIPYQNQAWVFFRGESLYCFSGGKGSIQWVGGVSTLQYQH